MGIYRIDVKSKDDTPDEYAAWKPTGTWFHRPYCSAGGVRRKGTAAEHI